MMMKVVTWNAEGMFVDGTKTRRATSHDALHALSALDADIVVVPEFGNLAELKESVTAAINALGYELVLSPYNDSRAPGLGFAIMSRIPVVRRHEYPLSVTDRTMIELYCQSEDGHQLRVIGVHLDDREESIRLKQVENVVDVVNADTVTPTVLMGDLNAMHRNSYFARMMRTKLAATAAGLLPEGQLSSVMRRVHEMASGETVDYILNHTPLQNTDPTLSPTISAKQSGMEWAPSLRLAKIDWIFVSPGLSAHSHHVRRDVGSDHRQVVVTIDG